MVLGLPIDLQCGDKITGHNAALWPDMNCADVELWTAVSQQSIYRNFSLWHHEFIKDNRRAALVVLRFIPTRLYHWYVLLTMARHSWFGT